MSNYRRAWVPGGTFFLTLVTYHRQPLFIEPESIEELRRAIAQVKMETPFDIIGAVILPNHIHFIWKLPPNDANLSRRVGRFKVLFTRSRFGSGIAAQTRSQSRRKHRESEVWQRRFWEHTIRTETEFSQCLDYIHYNPVKHGFVSCPHEWEYSSFHSWVKQGAYSRDWGCSPQSQSSLKLRLQQLETWIEE